ncbi:hypothetical protein JAAARDRAFT_691232, partial [Jaapia argillacea MUCL 33604]
MDPGQDLLVLAESVEYGPGSVFFSSESELTRADTTDGSFPSCVPQPNTTSTHHCRIHTRLLSTGEKHPLGPALGYFDHELEEFNIQWSFDMELCGLYLGAIFKSPDLQEVCVWAWQGGRLLMCLQSATRCEFHSFTFVSETLLLLAANYKECARLETHNFLEYGHGRVEWTYALAVTVYHYPNLP